MTLRTTRYAAALIGALLVCVGCGPQGRPQVEGSVVYGDKPVANQTLTLCILSDRPEDSVFHHVRLQPDGTFKADAPAPGVYKIVIEPDLSAREGKAPADEIKIPEKYRSAKTTDLEWNIVRGVNKKNFVLTD